MLRRFNLVDHTIVLNTVIERFPTVLKEISMYILYIVMEIWMGIGSGVGSVYYTFGGVTQWKE